MRPLRLTVAAILALVGTVWVGQGVGLIGGSFMTGSAVWAVSAWSCWSAPWRSCTQSAGAPDARPRDGLCGARVGHPRYARDPMNPIVDLRSDTVTHPTDAMRRAMADAPVGDDVFGDDPTVNELEARAAALLGKEAGLYVASGTMGNLVSLVAHLPRGYEAIAGATTHTVMDEAGGHAVVVGATVRALAERPDGTMDPAEISDAFRDPTDLHEPITGLVVLENTHAHSGGRPLPLEYVRGRRRDRARTGRAAPCGRGAVLQRRRRPRRRPCRAGGAGGYRDLLPLQGAVSADRLRRGRLGRVRRRARGAPASSWAAGCARLGSSRPPAWSPSPTVRTGRSHGWPRTTPTPGAWPRASRHSPASCPRAGSPSPTARPWTPPGS